MAILANRVRTKNFLIDIAKITWVSLRKFLILLFVLGSFGILCFSVPSFIPRILLETTGNVLSFGGIIYKESVVKVKLLSDRFIYLIDLEAENLKLRSELSLKKEEISNVNLIKLENQYLRTLLNVAATTQSNYITAKIMGLSLSPYSSSAIIAAGKKSGVSENDIVKTSEGIIGRIVEVSANYANVMLINDHNSRIPVITDSSKERGILAKQSDSLKLIYTNENHNIKVGETIYTSGDGKIYPQGMKVAIVEDINDNGIFVKMCADINNAEFVIVESKQ